MSRYFKTLSRIQAQRQEAAVARDLELRSSHIGESAELAGEGFPTVSPFARLPLARRQAVIAHLLDHLRAIADSRKALGIVIASASGFEPMELVIDGLASECQQRALRLLVGQVRQEGRRRLLDDHPDLRRFLGVDRSVSECLSGRAPGAVLKEWLERHHDHYDLAILEAPPVLHSADAVLLGKASGGLVLLVESLASTRQALRTSVERARSAGCPIVGLVLIGSKSRIPRWLQRLLLKSPHSQDGVN